MKFNLRQKVKFVNCGEVLSGQTGTVLGQSVRFAEFSHYIILLDIPMEDRLAVDITEHCLEAIND